MVRVSLVAALILGIGCAGCKTRSKPREPIWQGEKIGEIAPPPGERLPPPLYLATVALNVHVFDLPADNVAKLGAVWQVLSAKPIYLNSYNAFRENSFRLLFGRLEVWERIQALLVEAGGQKATTVSLAVADQDVTDLPITNLPTARQIAFVGNDLSQQTANVGPGLLTLRLAAQPIPMARGVRKIVGFPTYTVPVSGAIPELQARTQRREFYFDYAAAFACQMGPGDLLVLGPEKYTSERLTLGGLFFNNPQGTLFFNPNQPTPPEHKPAIRVYVLMCTEVRG